MSNTVRPSQSHVGTCTMCGLNLYRIDDVFTYGGQTHCAPCYERQVDRQRKRDLEAQKMSLQAMEDRIRYAAQSEKTVRQFLGDMPYNVLAAELGNHGLVIDDPYAKAAYTHATGDVIPETDVYGVCSCNNPERIGWHSYVRSDGTISGWHEAVSKVKAEYDSHLAQRLVPAMQEHARALSIQAKQQAEQAKTYMQVSDHVATNGHTFTWAAGDLNATVI